MKTVIIFFIRLFWIIAYAIKDVFSSKPKDYTGIGKSNTVVRHARVNGLKTINLKVSYAKPEDFLGLPKIKE